MTVFRMYVRCTRCGERGLLQTYTSDMLDRDPPREPGIAKAKAWILHHQRKTHAVHDPTRNALDRWLKGYQSELPPLPYDI